MSETIFSLFRYYLLGSPLEFIAQNSIIQSFKYLMEKNQHFFIIVVSLLLLGVLALIIGIMRYNKSRNVYIVYGVACVLLYTAYCLEKSFEVEKKLTDVGIKHSEKENNKNKSVPGDNISASKLFSSFVLENKNVKSFLSLFSNDTDNNSKLKDNESSTTDNEEFAESTSERNGKIINSPEIIKVDPTKKYISILKERIQHTQKTEIEYNKYLDDLKSNKKILAESYNKMIKTFDELNTVSKPIYDDLIAVDIVIPVYFNIAKDLGGEIINRFTFEEVKNIKETKSTQEVNVLGNNSDAIAASQKSGLYVQTIFEDLHNKSDIVSKSILNEKEKDVKNSIPFLERLQNLLIIQGILCFVVFLLYLFEFKETIKPVKLIIHIFLFINILVGILSLIFSQSIAKKCIKKDFKSCKFSPELDLEEISGLLGKNINTSQSHQQMLDFIKNEFIKSSEVLSRRMKRFENHLGIVIQNHIEQKISILENFTRKVLFLEDTFDDIIKKTVDKKEFYDKIYLIRGDLYKLKTNMSKIDTNTIISLYNNMMQDNYFFSTEKDNVIENIINLEKNENNQIERKLNNKCKESLDKICDAKEQMDQIGMIMIVFGLLFSILFLF
ncbi:hypothetical protein SLOPH_1695 [Spraguea lophii 42_110]|uniref:Uncharacterized protein n=1 Tax=Spraguea lophii (strain 42_110) TaxID=1358809 RepID=S7XJP9_SPRLO|nr:hypothetical protein SLOPH_1695 [Spraguea lophii 42_110]